MCHDKITLTATFLACLALPVSIFSVAAFQIDSDQPQLSEGKKAEAKKIEVHVRVSAKDGKPLPPKTVVEISGKEKACGSLNSRDETETIDEKGEAKFSLPVCKITVKVNVALYIPAIKQVDLADYKSPIVLTLDREQ